MNTIEQWLPIKGYEGLYEVSNIGRIRRTDCYKTRTNDGILIPANRKGYLMVHLSRNSVRRKFNIHRLVALAFIPNPDRNRWQVAHNNGNPFDNRVENLRWATVLENSTDRYRHGTIPWGAVSNRATLTEDHVRQIRVILRFKAASKAALSEMYGVTATNIIHIGQGKIWRHLLCPPFKPESHDQTHVKPNINPKGKEV